LGVGDADEATGPGFVHGHFGDEGDAHAGADHGKKAGKVAAFEDDARVETGAVAGGDGCIAEAMAVAKKKEWIAAKIRELQGGAPGELVSFRQRGVKAFGEKWVEVEFMATDRKGQNGQVHGAGAEAFEKNRGDFFGDSELDFRKFAGEGGETLCKPIGRDGGDGPDDNGAGFGLEAFGEFVFGAREFVEDGAGTRQKCFAQFGEAYGTAEAVKKPASEFGFEL